MITHASTGDLQKCEYALSDLITAKYLPSTTTINILLAGHICSSSTFHEQNLMRCYNKYFVTGDLVPDRFTYTQLLLACEKTGNVYDAANYFNKFLRTELRITVVMKNALMNAMGDEYPKYLSTLSEKDRHLLENVEIVEHSMKKDTKIVFSSKNLGAKPVEKKKKPKVVQTIERKVYAPQNRR